MHNYDIIDDGFTVRMHGEVRLRVNKLHVQRCKDAIRRRWDNEAQHTIDPNNVVDLTYARKRGKVST
jgi:hypothetical protein